MPQPVQHRGLTLLVPDNDSEWKEYFAHARAHRLVMRKCTACGLMRYPPTHACPWCMDLGWSWKEVSGRGTIHSYEIVMHAIQPGFKEVSAVSLGLIELDSSAGYPRRTRPADGGQPRQPDGTMEDEKKTAPSVSGCECYSRPCRSPLPAQFTLIDDRPEGQNLAFPRTPRRRRPWPS